MIRIEGYVKTYGQVRALDGLSLQVDPGVVYGFLGPNGAGKTTTMRLLTGLAQPTSGQAWIGGKQVGAAGQETRHLLGVLPEEPAFYPWMTPLEYLRDFIAPLYGIPAKTAADKAAAMLDLTGLAEAAKRRIGGFSRGMRQRLGLAQALIHDPQVLLLDEPVSALDPAGRKEVLALLEHLRGKVTILLSTHILADVERVCDVVGIINKGRLVIQEKRADLLAKYALPQFVIEASDGFHHWVEQAGRLSSLTRLSVEDNTATVLVNDVRLAQKELLASLAEHDVAVRRFEIVQPDLEDIFLRLTES
jgi:ABC-2 type transport system ATP-binding protein